MKEQGQLRPAGSKAAFPAQWPHGQLRPTRRRWTQATPPRKPQGRPGRSHPLEPPHHPPFLKQVPSADSRPPLSSGAREARSRCESPEPSPGLAFSTGGFLSSSRWPRGGGDSEGGKGQNGLQRADATSQPSSSASSLPRPNFHGLLGSASDCHLSTGRDKASSSSGLLCSTHSGMKCHAPVGPFPPADGSGSADLDFGQRCTARRRARGHCVSPTHLLEKSAGGKARCQEPMSSQCHSQ